MMASWFSSGMGVGRGYRVAGAVVVVGWMTEGSGIRERGRAVAV